MTVKRKKISQRLQQLDNMITKPYSHIWDCCCDHGLLGLTLLERQAAGTVHFVDCVPDIMSELTKVLERFFTDTGTIADSDTQSINTKLDLKSNLKTPTKFSWKVHCEDVGLLSIPDESASQLIIIAGVGGEQTAELVTKIINSHPKLRLEFLLCPVHYHYHLRKQLQRLNCSLIDEKLLCENKRFYEFIHVVSDVEQKKLDKSKLESKIVSEAELSSISAVGSVMWDFSLGTHRRYLEKILNHYRRMGKNNQDDVSDIIDAYQMLGNKR